MTGADGRALAAWLDRPPRCRCRGPRLQPRRSEGRSSSSADSSPTAATPARVDAYDPRADSWSRLPDLPVSVDHAAAASWRGRVVVVGGTTRPQPLRAAFLYDGRTWRGCRRRPRNAPPRPQPRRPTAACGSSAGAPATASRRGRSRSTCGRSLEARPRPASARAPRCDRARRPRLRDRRPPRRIRHQPREPSRLRPATNRWSASPTSPIRAAERAPPRSQDVSSPSAASRPAARTRGLGHSHPGRRWYGFPTSPLPRHGLGVVALAGRVWAIAGGPEPGLTVSGAVESLPVP